MKQLLFACKRYDNTIWLFIRDPKGIALFCLSFSVALSFGYSCVQYVQFVLDVESLRLSTPVFLLFLARFVVGVGSKLRS